MKMEAGKGSLDRLNAVHHSGMISTKNLYTKSSGKPDAKKLPISGKNTRSRLQSMPDKLSYNSLGSTKKSVVHLQPKASTQAQQKPTLSKR